MSIRQESIQMDSKRNCLVWLILTISLITLGVVIVFVIRQPAPIEGVQIYDRQPRGHDDGYWVTPSDLPPVGGKHHNEWQNCGIYRQPVETEKALHSMEHGAVWLTYRPELDPAEVAQLEALVHEQPYLLLSPFPGQRSPVAITAWGVQLEANSAADDRLPAFIMRYRLGPTTPERGAACTDGFGQPLP